MVERDLQAGRQLLNALDQTDIPIAGAFWYQLPEFGEWRLFLVSPWVDTRGPLAAYERLQTVLNGSPTLVELGIDIRSVSVVSPGDTWVKFLVSRWPTGRGASEVAMPSGDHPGIRVANAHVYRLERDARATRAIRR